MSIGYITKINYIPYHHHFTNIYETQLLHNRTIEKASEQTPNTLRE